MQSSARTALILRTLGGFDLTKFDSALREELLALPRVGPRILAHLERAGLHSIESLARRTLEEVVLAVRESARTASSDGLMWLRSSKTRASLSTVLKFARRRR